MEHRNDALAVIFERERPRLRRIAWRMLGDRGHAEDAVQETWLKAGTIPSEEIRNAGAWLSTITTRVCLDRLRHRRRRAPRRAVALDDPDDGRNAANVVGDEGPEHAALMADAVGVALLIILERLAPLERVAFVLHDVFALPFDEIAGLIDRTPDAARQLASRARRRVKGDVEADGSAISVQRDLAERFLRASRSGDMAALLALLDPEVVLTADAKAASLGAGDRISGSPEVGRFFMGRAQAAHVVLLDGLVAIIVAPGDRLLLAVVPRFSDGRIAAMHAVGAPETLAAFDLKLA